MNFRRFFSLTVAFWLLVAFVIPVSVAAAADDSDAWTIYFRPGTRFGTDDRTLFILDFLVPIYQGERNILFFNPRLTPDDHDGLEVNLGLGYRHLLLGDKLILGGNVFYDNRRTGWGTRWEQVGVGAEAMAELNKYVALTGRFNYYFPLTGARVSGTGGPATGYYFRTGGIWIGGGGLAYEEAPEGFDGELGVRIPFVSDYVETWVYGGGYHYHGSHVGTIDGWTARLEVIPTNFLRLAYEYRDDNTTRRGDHYGEVTFEVPFSIEKLVAGKNPFEGLGKRLSGSRDMKERLVESVRRDVDIRIVHGGSAAAGGYEILVEDVVFVSENGDDTTGDGSFENPFNSIGRAVTAIHSGGVYSGITTIHVMDDGGTGAGGGTADIANLMIWGSAMPHPTYGYITNQYLTAPDVSSYLDIAADNVEVFGSNFTDPLCGINTGGYGTYIHDNTFTADPVMDYGVYTYGGSATISGNTFTNFNYGIYAERTPVTISNNTFAGGSYGVYTYDPDNLMTLTITDNIIGTADDPLTDSGIYSYAGTVYAEISGNDITVHGSGSVSGISILDADFALSNNNITVTSDTSGANGIGIGGGDGSILGSITGGTITVNGYTFAQGINIAPSIGTIGISGDPLTITGVTINVNRAGNPPIAGAYAIRLYNTSPSGYIFATVTGNTVNVTAVDRRLFLWLSCTHASGNAVDWGSVPGTENTYNAYDLLGNPASWSGNYDVGGSTTNGPVETNFTTGITP